VRSDQPAYRVGIVLDELDYFAIILGVVMELEIDAFDQDIAQAEVTHPGREHAHDRGLCRGYPDKIEGGLGGRSVH
jgi:hypothetical protein